MIIAIDPGASGGIVVYKEPNKHLEAFKMPKTEKGIVDIFKDALSVRGEMYEKRVVVYMELVRGFIGGTKVKKVCPQCKKVTWDTVGHPASRMFNFGEGYGILKGIIASHELKLNLITPQVWQKVIMLGQTKGGLTKTEWKNKLKSRAEILFPDIKRVTLAISDALLILEYARRVEYSNF